MFFCTESNDESKFIVPFATLFDSNRFKLISDLRNPSTVPLNFTKSINLALSERGIHAMKNAGHISLLPQVLQEAIPMHARMIHGRQPSGDLFEESQQYDANGRV